VIVSKGTIHLYKYYEETTPYVSIHLKEAEIIDTASGESAGREYVFGVKTQSGDPRWFAAGSPNDLNLWKEIFLQAKNQESSQPPTRVPVPRSKRTNTAIDRAKKGVISRIGVPVLKKLFGENVRLLNSIKKMVEKNSNKETANKVHTLLIKFIIKINFLFDKKNLTLASLEKVDPPLRKALEILSKYYNTRVRRRVADVNVFVKVEALLAEARDEMIKELEKYLTPKNIENFRYLCDTLANGKFLEKVYACDDQDELPEELDDLDDLITQYTQFHI